MTLRIHRVVNEEAVTFTLSGRIQMEHLPELSDLLERDCAEHRIVFDLREVRLVDREAVSYLMRCEAAGARLDNCPGYIREWIWEERKTHNTNEKEK
jgi:hypothetical protein